MPAYRVSMSHQKSFYVPGLPGSKAGEVVISAKSLQWLARFRTNNAIESWTLQFVEEFTWAIELQQRWKDDKGPEHLSLKTALNQIEFAKEFFPHLYRENSESFSRILRKIHSELGKSPHKARSDNNAHRESSLRPASVR